MTTTLTARFARYSTRYLMMCCLGLGCASAANAQTYGIESRLVYSPVAFRLSLQAVKVGDNYYAVRMLNSAYFS